MVILHDKHEHEIWNKAVLERVINLSIHLLIFKKKSSIDHFHKDPIGWKFQYKRKWFFEIDQISVSLSHW